MKFNATEDAVYFSYEKTLRTDHNNQDKDQKQKRQDNSKSKDRKKDYGNQRKLKRGEQ